MTRIYYKNKFFYYPLKPFDAFFGVGPFSSARIVASYFCAKIKGIFSPKTEEKTFDDWIIKGFGKKLFQIFFKTYTEKVWGIPTSQISAEWAGQRIKGLSLAVVVKNALFPKKNSVKTLIEEFDYPLLGAGMMYEKMAEIILRNKENKLLLGEKIGTIKHNGSKILRVVL